MQSSWSRSTARQPISSTAMPGSRGAVVTVAELEMRRLTELLRAAEVGS